MLLEIDRPSLLMVPATTFEVRFSHPCAQDYLPICSAHELVKKHQRSFVSLLAFVRPFSIGVVGLHTLMGFVFVGLIALLRQRAY